MLEIKPIFNALLRSKAGALMLLIQIAITLAIVSNAAFIINDRISYLNQETGYPEEELFQFSVMTYGTDIDLEQQFERDLNMLKNISGVTSAGLFSTIPLSGSGSASSFHLSADIENSRGVRAAYTLGDENSIQTLGVNLVEGRSFTSSDVLRSDDNTAVPETIVVSKPFADEMFPETGGLGETVYFGPSPSKIVGIVDHMKGPWLKDSAVDKFVIFPRFQSRSFQRVLVRTQANERSAVMRQIEDLMLAEYSKRVVVGLQGLDESKQEYNAADILMMRMLIVLIVVLVLVTALGIFGLTIFNINKRTKQIGTRRALGARKSSIVRYFLVENSIICVFGLVIGGIGAVYLGQALLDLYSLPKLDYLYIVFTAVFVLVISLLSVVMPANKAANISPSVATRSI